MASSNHSSSCQCGGSGKIVKQREYGCGGLQYFSCPTQQEGWRERFDNAFRYEQLTMVNTQESRDAKGAVKAFIASELDRQRKGLRTTLEKVRKGFEDDPCELGSGLRGGADDCLAAFDSYEDGV